MIHEVKVQQHWSHTEVEATDVTLHLIFIGSRCSSQLEKSFPGVFGQVVRGQTK